MVLCRYPSLGLNLWLGLSFDMLQIVWELVSRLGGGGAEKQFADLLPVSYHLRFSKAHDAVLWPNLQTF